MKSGGCSANSFSGRSQKRDNPLHGASQFEERRFSRELFFAMSNLDLGSELAFIILRKVKFPRHRHHIPLPWPGQAEFAPVAAERPARAPFLADVAHGLGLIAFLG